MIKFFKGLREKYNAELHGLGIYFATDTLEIIHNGKSYSGLLSAGKSVKNITLVDGVMTITYTDETSTNIEVGSGKYQSKIEDSELEMPASVGGIVKGTKLGSLSGKKSYDEMFDELLFPTMNPTKSEPSVSGFELNSNVDLVELGTAVVSISEAGLNQGNWNEYNNNAPYAGDLAGVVYTFNINGETFNNIEDLVDKNYSTLGNQTYQAEVSYNAGVAPKNNKGVEVEYLACPAGSINATKTVNVTAPWYASTITAGVLTRQALLPWNTASGSMSTGEFELKPHTETAPQSFKLPRKATNVQMFNTVAKQFETVALSDWAESSASEAINTIDHTYYTYTYKGSARSSVKLIVKF